MTDQDPETIDYRWLCRCDKCGAEIRVKIIEPAPRLTRLYFAEGFPDKTITTCPSCHSELTNRSVIGEYTWELREARKESLALGLPPLQIEERPELLPHIPGMQHSGHSERSEAAAPGTSGGRGLSGETQSKNPDDRSVAADPPRAKAKREAIHVSGQTASLPHIPDQCTRPCGPLRKSEPPNIKIPRTPATVLDPDAETLCEFTL